MFNVLLDSVFSHIYIVYKRRVWTEIPLWPSVCGLFFGGGCVPILALCGGGRKKQDFTPLTEYPPWGVF